MKLTQDGELLAENKVLILYILNKLERPITNEGLLRLILAVMDMNYFYFQQFLLDLLERQYITCFNKDGKTVYKITDLGKTTLELTNDIIPGIIKLKVDTSFSGELKENDILPSVRTMAKELKISALTVKKAYDNLEAEGMTVTVHGKGTYVAASNTQLMEEERRKEVEADLEAAIQKGRRCGMKEEEIRSLFELIMEDE